MIRFFAGHPTAANLLMIALIAIGLFALPGLLRETMPDYASTEVEVRVIYPGASAEDVEEAVCGRIEDAVDGIDGVAELRSEAREGIGIVVAEMRDGYGLERFLNEVKREVDAIDDFPDLAEPPIVQELGWTR
jgi:multidrug efflux pump subunit AcrB